MNKYLSWDYYDEALLGLACSPVRMGDKIIEYDRVWSHIVKYLRFLELIIKAFNKRNITIVDLGCADGRFARTLSHNSAFFDSIDYIGVDARRNIIGKVAKNLNKRCMKFRFRVLDITKSWIFDNNSIDIIILSQTLKYLKLQDGIRVLEKSLTSLNDNGMILVSHSVPSIYDKTDWNGYFGQLTISGFKKMVHEIGFDIMEQFPVETCLTNRTKCEDVAILAYPSITVLPSPFRVLLGLNLKPELAQQFAFQLKKSTSRSSTDGSELIDAE